jgi:hypothetical protein
VGLLAQTPFSDVSEPCVPSLEAQRSPAVDVTGVAAASLSQTALYHSSAATIPPTPIAIAADRHACSRQPIAAPTGDILLYQSSVYPGGRPVLSVFTEQWHSAALALPATPKVAGYKSASPVQEYAMGRQSAAAAVSPSVTAALRALPAYPHLDRGGRSMPLGEKRILVRTSISTTLTLFSTLT